MSDTQRSYCNQVLSRYPHESVFSYVYIEQMPIPLLPETALRVLVHCLTE